MRKTAPTIALITALLCGCASGPLEVDRLEIQSPADQLADLRIVLNELRENPLLTEAPEELQRAETLLTEADTLLTVEPDNERLPLVLLALEQQLVLMRTYTQRRRAEIGLEQLRASHEGRMMDLEAQRRDADAALDTLRSEGDTP